MSLSHSLIGHLGPKQLWTVPIGLAPDEAPAVFEPPVPAAPPWFEPPEPPPPSSEPPQATTNSGKTTAKNRPGFIDLASESLLRRYHLEASPRSSTKPTSWLLAPSDAHARNF